MFNVRRCVYEMNKQLNKTQVLFNFYLYSSPLRFLFLCSEFKVNAIDADELRKSQRKIKRNALAKKNPSLNVDVTNFSVSGSQESDDDDDEGGSTPSADNSEKASSLTLSRYLFASFSWY